MQEESGCVSFMAGDDQRITCYELYSLFVQEDNGCVSFLARADERKKL